MILLLKLLLAPSLVALASLASRRWGLKVGGAIAGFPVVFGPIILFIAIEQGNAFAASAALRGLFSIGPFGCFVLAMSWASTRFSQMVAVLAGWAAYLAMSWLGMAIELSPWLAAAVGLLGIVLGRALLPQPHAPHAGDPISVYDIPVRMASTLVLLLSVTAAAKPMGPSWSGAMAAFPVASTVLGVFARRSNGPFGPAQLYRGTLLGSLAFGSFCLILHALLLSDGLAGAFAAALGGAVLMQIGVLFLASRPN